jgi:hypothetical protein
MKREMQEELTEAMHAEFDVDEETEISMNVLSLLCRCEDLGTTIERELKRSTLTAEQVEKYKHNHAHLFDQNTCSHLFK